MKLDEQTMRLIAIGASIAANCQPCLRTNATRALESGADETEIAEAIRVGRLVRQGAASIMDRFATDLNSAGPRSEIPATGECGCSP